MSTSLRARRRAALVLVVPLVVVACTSAYGTADDADGGTGTDAGGSPDSGRIDALGMPDGGAAPDGAEASTTFDGGTDAPAPCTKKPNGASCSAKAECCSNACATDGGGCVASCGAVFDSCGGSRPCCVGLVCKAPFCQPP